MRARVNTDQFMVTEKQYNKGCAQHCDQIFRLSQLRLEHRTSVMREFSASRHFFKTNVTQSVAKLILYSQKTQNCGQFLSNLMN